MTQRIAQLAPNVLRGLALLLAVSVAYLDVATGYELSLSVLYLIPTAFAVWFLGRRWGVLVALLSALLWLSADLLAGHAYSRAGIAGWNTLIRLTFFLVVVVLLLALKAQLARVTLLARTDALTGLLTRGPFFEALARETERSRRYHHPLTVAYLDVDDFKDINDRLGHAAGDEVLVSIATALRSGTRVSDVAARIGGDEFALVIPEADETAAHATLERVREGVAEAARAAGTPVTLSIGATCFRTVPETDDAMLRSVDDLMYEVKRTGKNGVRFRSMP